MLLLLTEMLFFRILNIPNLLYLFIDRKIRNERHNTDFTSILKFNMLFALVQMFLDYSDFVVLENNTIVFLTCFSLLVSLVVYFFNRDAYYRDFNKIQDYLKNGWKVMPGFHHPDPWKYRPQRNALCRAESHRRKMG
jgi:hypothetical protein